MAVLAGIVSYANVPDIAQQCSRILGAQKAYARDEMAFIGLGSAHFAGPAPSHLSSGQQRSPSNRRWLIVADVRLDNRRDLIRRLGAQMVPADPDDNAILLAAWIKWGPAALDAVIGAYAFAIYDHEEKTLVLARDSSGDHPLFYARNESGIAFASMPSGLRSIAAQPPSLAALAAQLSGLSLGSDESIFAGIKRVAPGELVRITSSALERVLHWQPRLYHRGEPAADRQHSRGDYVDQYRHLLTEAVASRLPVDDSPVGSQLSSGWDSNAVTSTAALLHKAGVVAFTAAPVRRVPDRLPRGRIADETALASLTARRHHIDHVIVRETAPLFEVVRRQSALLQAPVPGGFNMAWWEAIRNGARQRGATHLLTGELGNFTLNAGGLLTLSEWVRRSMWRAWWREARAAARRPDVRWRGIMVNSFGHRLSSRALTALRQIFLQLPPEDSISFLRKHWRERMVHEAVSEPRPNGDAYLARLEAIREHDPGIYRKSAIAQSGVQESDPTADRRLAEFSLTLPPEQLFHNGQSRPLARAALADRVPAAILDSQVRGLQSADWYLHFHQREAFEVLEEIEPRPAVRDLLDINRMRRAIEEWPDRDWNSERHVATYRFKLMGALATGIFLTQFSGQST